MSNKLITWEDITWNIPTYESSTKKKAKSPENQRIIVDIRVKDNDHCHNLCPYMNYRGSTTFCKIFHRQLDRHYDDHIRCRVCKEAQYVG